MCFKLHIKFCVSLSSLFPRLHYQIYFSSTHKMYPVVPFSSTIWYSASTESFLKNSVLSYLQQKIAQLVSRFVSSDSLSLQSLIKWKLIFSYSCKKSEPSDSINLSWSIYGRSGQRCIKLSDLADEKWGLVAYHRQPVNQHILLISSCHPTRALVYRFYVVCSPCERCRPYP